MKNFTQSCYRSSIIALLILIALPAVLIDKASAEALYEEQIPLSEAELAQILAPIALYPDSLLTHILIASTYPLEIVQANRWRTKNKHLDANQAITKAADKNWDPSISALLAFPNLLARLSDDLDWTQKLGAAFLQDEAALLVSIQSLRQQADQANSLSELDNMSVTHIDNQIIIESAHNGIIYVPYYDPRIVYGQWHWYSYPPVYWAPSPYYTRRSHGNFYWGSGVQISFNYYFSTFNWHKRNIIVVNHHNSHDYRHRRRIITSSGAHRWQHKPQPYSRAHIKQRNGQHDSSRGQSKNAQNNERHQLFDKKINGQKNREQRIDNKSNHNKVHSNSQLEQKNKRPDRQRRSDQVLNNRAKINSQENRGQRIDKKSNHNKARSSSQLEQKNKRPDRQIKRDQLINNRVKVNSQENRRQRIDNKTNHNKVRSSLLEKQNKRPDRKRKSDQAIHNRVKTNSQENRSQSRQTGHNPRLKILESAER